MGSAYCTINVNVTDCVELPEVPVTVTWDVPAGVPLGPVEELPPPQPVAAITMTRTKDQIRQAQAGARFLSACVARTKTKISPIRKMMLTNRE